MVFAGHLEMFHVYLRKSVTYQLLDYVTNGSINSLAWTDQLASSHVALCLTFLFFYALFSHHYDLAHIIVHLLMSFQRWILDVGTAARMTFVSVDQSFWHSFYKQMCFLKVVADGSSMVCSTEILIQTFDGKSHLKLVRHCTCCCFVVATFLI